MRCPVCKAENALDATCRRCKADLSLLIALEESRARALAEAAQSAITGDAGQTLVHAEAAHRLRADADSWRMLALASLLARDYALALACWRQAAGELR